MMHDLYTHNGSQIHPEILTRTVIVSNIQPPPKKKGYWDKWDTLVTSINRYMGEKNFSCEHEGIHHYQQSFFFCTRYGTLYEKTSNEIFTCFPTPQQRTHRNKRFLNVRRITNHDMVSSDLLPVEVHHHSKYVTILGFITTNDPNPKDNTIWETKWRE
jgi:hypothetical protein